MIPCFDYTGLDDASRKPSFVQHQLREKKKVVIVSLLCFQSYRREALRDGMINNQSLDKRYEIIVDVVEEQ